MGHPRGKTSGKASGKASIRAARPEEAGGLVPTFEWLFAPPGSPPPRWEPDQAVVRLRQAIDAAASEVLVAALDGRVVGICTVYLDLESVRFGRRAWVEDLAVDHAHRSRGIGKALLDAAKAWARERGASHLELDSGEARTDAHRFYERERPSWRSISYGWRL